MHNQWSKILILSTSLLWSQSEPVMTKSLLGTLHFTQTAHDNWTPGGEDVLTWFLDVKSKFSRETEGSVFKAEGHANYGKTRIAAAAARKSLDELRLDTFYARKLDWAVNPYFSAQLSTQMAAGYTFTDSSRKQVSAFLNPGYFIQTLGLGISHGEDWAVRMGASVKETISRRFPLPVMGEPGVTESFRRELGVQAEGDWKKQIGDESLLTSELDLFSSFKGIERIDVSWDNNITTRFAKYFQTSFQYKIVYDWDLSRRRQVKSVLSFGVQYTII